MKTILIANRGEIAVRIMRTARALGYGTVAVYADADAGAPHVALADQALRLGPAPVGESYLHADRLLAAARLSGADAVHPGYGFLSENASFARACLDAGLVWIGPPPAVIALMGDKGAARARVAAHGVPVLPGYAGDDQSDAAFSAAALEIGYPVMVKAAAGGGGRGMRLVGTPDALPAALAGARSEAGAAFGDPTLLLEKALPAPRHVEVQIFGDSHGNVVHLGERDCSLQRRHQKVIEEAPAPGLDPALRDGLGMLAATAAEAIGYVGAGTLEFLLDGDSFYFIEMNTRLQVEHPVTELITGLDLVAWQLRVAAGEPLPLRQVAVDFSGHAMEARLYAETPENGFLPATGEVLAWEPPAGAGIRVDHALAPGLAVTPHYDPLLAKIIAHGATREEARRRLVAALRQTHLPGVATNRRFLLDLLQDPAFAAGDVSTTFIADRWRPGEPPDLAPLAALLHCLQEADAVDAAFRHWRSLPAAYRFDDGRLWQVAAAGPARFTVHGPDGTALTATLVAHQPGATQLTVDGADRRLRHARAADGALWLETADGAAGRFRNRLHEPPDPTRRAGSGRVTTPMPGRLIRLAVAPGDAVRRGDLLGVVEAMKMEHPVTAPVDGVVADVAVRQGAQLAAGAPLLTITPNREENP